MIKAELLKEWINDLADNDDVYVENGELFATNAGWSGILLASLEVGGDIPRIVRELEFADYTYYAEQDATFATNNQLSMGLWIREGIKGSPKYTLVSIDETVAVTLDTYNAPSYELLKTDSEDELRRFISNFLEKWREESVARRK